MFDPFSIGPTSIMGRTIALRVLFFKSMIHLRRDLLRFFLHCLPHTKANRFNLCVLVPSPEKPTRDLSRRLRAKTLHERENEGGDGSLEEHHADGSDLRGMVSCSQDASEGDNYFKDVKRLAHLVEMEVKHRCNQVLELGFPLGGLAKLFAQEWEGDVTVVMPATLAQYSKIIQNPTHLELQKAANRGSKCTWEKLSAIKANCGIELALDECVAVLNHMRRLKRSAERAASSHHGLASTTRFNAPRRVPSWNVIARENSTGSLDDLVVESNLHASSGRNLSDSETENADLSSWTRTGGPLMRTASANKFVDFVQGLDGDIALTRGFSSGPSSPAAKTSSITFTEGNLLQPERTSNGIVLNVVRRENLGVSIGNQNTELPESVQLDIPEKEMDNSSVSEHEVDKEDDGEEEEHNGSV